MIINNLYYRKVNTMTKTNHKNLNDKTDRLSIIKEMILNCKYKNSEGQQLPDSRIKFIANQVSVAYKQQEQYSEGNPEYRIKGTKHWDAKAQEIESPDTVLNDDLKHELMDELAEMRKPDDLAYKYWRAEYIFFADVYEMVTGEVWKPQDTNSKKVTNNKAFLLR